MPKYRYECPECGEEFTKIQDHHTSTPECPKCGYGGTNKMVSRASLRFKGSGFYKTDYRNKNNQEEESSAK